MIGMLDCAATTDDSSTRSLRHSRARFAAPPLLHVPSTPPAPPPPQVARKSESSLFQLRIGSAETHGRSDDTGQTDRPAAARLAATGDLRGGCGSDSLRLAAASVDSRMVGSATAVSGSSAALVRAARYDTTPAAAGRTSRSYVNLAVMSRLSFLYRSRDDVSRTTYTATPSRRRQYSPCVVAVSTITTISSLIFISRLL